jgi:hypothetical protein
LSAAQRSYYLCYAYWHHNWYNYYRYTQLIYSYFGDPYLQIGTVPANGPTVVSVPATRAQYGVPYWYDDDGQAEAVGSGPITWDKVSGPGYFHIDASGTADWTPEKATEPNNSGRPMVVVRATDDNGSTYHRWVVQCGGGFLRITSVPTLQGCVGQAYRYDADDTAEVVSSSSEIPLCWKKIAGPLDLDVDPEKGTVAWTPNKTGEYEVVLGVFQGYYCATQRFVVNVESMETPTADGSAALTSCLVLGRLFAVETEDESFGFDPLLGTAEKQKAALEQP